MNFLKQINELFNVNYFNDEFDPEGALYETSQKVLTKYEIDKINAWFFEYIRNNCKTLDEIYNAINLYYCYTFDEKPMKNALYFVSYIFHKFGNLIYDTKYNFLESFLIGLLDKNKIIDLANNPYYSLESDQRIISIINDLK